MHGESVVLQKRCSELWFVNRRAVWLQEKCITSEPSISSANVSSKPLCTQGSMPTACGRMSKVSKSNFFARCLRLRTARLKSKQSAGYVWVEGTANYQTGPAVV